MADDMVRFFGGPKDGDLVKIPPRMEPVHVDEVESSLLPPYLELKSGGHYELNLDAKRYEWVP
jgi:hypothetical protein